MALSAFLNKDILKCSSFKPLSRAMTVEGIMRFDAPTNYSLNLAIKDLSDLSFPYCITNRLITILRGLRLLMKWVINY